MEDMIGHIFGTLDSHDQALRIILKNCNRVNRHLTLLYCTGIAACWCTYQQQKQINELRNRLNTTKDEGMG